MMLQYKTYRLALQLIGRGWLGQMDQPMPDLLMLHIWHPFLIWSLWQRQIKLN